MLSADGGCGMMGDFNGDEAVNALDYVMWRDSLDAEVAAYSGADATGDGMVGEDDGEMWRSHFGALRADTESDETEMLEDDLEECDEIEEDDVDDEDDLGEDGDVDDDEPDEEDDELDDDEIDMEDEVDECEDDDVDPDDDGDEPDEESEEDESEEDEIDEDEPENDELDNVDEDDDVDESEEDEIDEDDGLDDEDGELGDEDDELDDCDDGEEDDVGEDDELDEDPDDDLDDEDDIDPGDGEEDDLDEDEDVDGEDDDEADELDEEDEEGDADDDPVEIGQADINIASTIITGTPNVDKIQGFFGDDVIDGGGGGPEGYVVSTGRDVITDFNPAEDVLLVNDFGPDGKYAPLGLETLTTLEALRAASTETTVVFDGVEQPALVIDTDADAGDFTTTLLGVRLEDLSNENVQFTFGEEGTREIEPFTHLPALRVTATDGSVITVPAHSVAVHPQRPVLESGTQEAYDTLLNAVTYGEADQGFGMPVDELTALDSAFASL